jgi:hypothetical protein
MHGCSVPSCTVGLSVWVPAQASQHSLSFSLVHTGTLGLVTANFRPAQVGEYVDIVIALPCFLASCTGLLTLIVWVACFPACFWGVPSSLVADT